MTDPRSPRADWRHADDIATPAARRGGRLAATLIGFVGLTGALAGLAYWVLSPKPVRFVTVPVGEYTDPSWLPNLWAEQDSERLREAFPGQSEKAFNFQERDRLTALLDALKAERGRPVVLHVTALAATHGGDVYLLPGNAKPGDPAGWLKVSELLDKFAAGAAPHKLLLIDVTKDDRLDGLDAVLAADRPGVLILSSSSPGEDALSMDEMQVTAFAHFVAEGLTGAAEENRDGRVSVRELAAYVTAKVRAWAARTRGQSQTPKLYGSADDFDLTYGPAPALAPPPPRNYPARLADAWAERDKLAPVLVHAHPAALNELDSTLLKAEQDWESGFEKRAFSHITGDMGKIRPALQAAKVEPAWLRPPGDVPPPLPPDAAKAFDAWLTARAAVSKPADPAKLSETEKAARLQEGEKLTKARAEFLAKALEVRPAAAGRVCAAAAADPEPTPEFLRDLAALLAEVGAPPTGEQILLRKVAEWDPKAIRWPGPAVHSLLKCERAAADALAGPFAGFPWARERFGAAAKQRRDGERALFAATTGAAARTAADQLDEAALAFKAAQALRDGMRLARMALDESARLLTGTKGDVEAGGEPGEVAWRALATAAAQLADRIDRPPGTYPDLIGPMAELKAARAALERRTPAARLAAKPTEYYALRSLIQSPLLPSAERKAVWTAANDRARKIADDPGLASTPPPPRARADLAADLAADLKRLAGKGGDEVPAALRAARVATAATPGQPPAVRRARDEARQALTWLAAQARADAELRKDVPGAAAYYEGFAADCERARE